MRSSGLTTLGSRVLSRASDSRIVQHAKDIVLLIKVLLTGQARQDTIRPSSDDVGASSSLVESLSPPINKSLSDRVAIESLSRAIEGRGCSKVNDTVLFGHSADFAFTILLGSVDSMNASARSAKLVVVGTLRPLFLEELLSLHGSISHSSHVHWLLVRLSHITLHQSQLDLLVPLSSHDLLLLRLIAKVDGLVDDHIDQTVVEVKLLRVLILLVSL